MKILFTALILVINCKVLAADLFVSIQGSDVASGTSDLPIRALGHAARIAKAGDTVIIRSGIYRETLTMRNSGVYLDSYCSNFIVHHNVIWDCGEGIRMNSPAKGHKLYNNTLFNCDDIDTHTYNQWPNHTPAYWTERGYGNIYEFVQTNNLFLRRNPDLQHQND